MIPAYENSIFILSLFTVLACVVYPSFSLKLVSISLLSYYLFLLWYNEIAESHLFLSSLIALLIYLLLTLFRLF